MSRLRDGDDFYARCCRGARGHEERRAILRGELGAQRLVLAAGVRFVLVARRVVMQCFGEIVLEAFDVFP